MGNDLVVIATGTILGTIARISMLRADYRQYPSYPQGYTIHLTLGGVAAFIGSVAIPAVVAEDYAAATFLALAATQFREVRNIERETLQNMESTELVIRGPAYIEGIARIFEARNYLAMLTALVVTLAMTLTERLSEIPVWALALLGAAAGTIAIVLLKRVMEGANVGHLAQVEIAKITFDGPLLTVDGNPLMNVGSEDARDEYRQHGMAVRVKPRDIDAKATLSNTGQRQAIAHNAAALLGIRKDVDTPQFTPLVRRNIDTGDLILVIVPFENDQDALLQAVRDTPIIEGARRKPSVSPAAQEVD